MNGVFFQLFGTLDSILVIFPSLLKVKREGESSGANARDEQVKICPEYCWVPTKNVSWRLLWLWVYL